MEFRPCRAQATHITVPLPFELGAYSQLKELGMDLRASDGPWAGKRQATVTHVLNSNGNPLPVCWDSAARSLEFGAPGPLIRSVHCGAPVPKPRVADAGQQKKILKTDSDTTVVAPDSHETLSTLPDTRTTTLGEQTI